MYHHENTLQFDCRTSLISDHQSVCSHAARNSASSIQTKPMAKLVACQFLIFLRNYYIRSRSSIRTPFIATFQASLGPRPRGKATPSHTGRRNKGKKNTNIGKVIQSYANFSSLTLSRLKSPIKEKQRQENEMEDLEGLGRSCNAHFGIASQGGRRFPFLWRRNFGFWKCQVRPSW